MKIESFCTPCPIRVSSDTSVVEALEMMKQHDIRHLPVHHEGTLIGVLSEHDVFLSLWFCETSGVTPEAGDVCSKDPFVVRASTELSQVTREMSESKSECALVIDNSDQLLGVFTTTDALRLAHFLLEERGK